MEESGTSMEEPDLQRDVVPATILTGFLGAGKTTLLNRILNGDHGLRTAVLVNDFGSINIDTELIVGVEDNAISLANGCVCCEIRDDLLETIEQLLLRPEQPEYILLEASGVADPSGIAMTFVQADLRDQVRLDSIIAVVDAEQVFANPEYPALQELKLRQIGFSDMVILNKVDLVHEQQHQEVREWINGRMNRVRIVEASYCEVPLEVLLGVGRFESEQLTYASASDTAHGQVFQSWSFESEAPMSIGALEEMVKRQLPASVYRCKGIVYAAEQPDLRAVLQVVGRRATVAFEEPWGTRSPRTQIVAIGEPGALIPRELDDLFAGCLAENLAHIVQ
jgi:G3E family GTPase